MSLYWMLWHLGNWPRQLLKIRTLPYFEFCLSCKIFEPLGFTSTIQQLSSLNSDPLHSKMAPLWHQNKPIHFPLGKAAPPLFILDHSWSRLTHITYHINLSVRWNTLLRNQISSCQQVFYYMSICHRDNSTNIETEQAGTARALHALDHFTQV